MSGLKLCYSSTPSALSPADKPNEKPKAWSSNDRFNHDHCSSGSKAQFQQVLYWRCVTLRPASQKAAAGIEQRVGLTTRQFRNSCCRNDKLKNVPVTRVHSK
ncbi:hypothetical protein R1flu_001203 [Riccia fluitans]|uniref:Uncharacterized protein n=1 Tax=Riccia fluitans TaxID=41844 RepID=A0ABD1Y2L1_9MARC